MSNTSTVTNEFLLNIALEKLNRILDLPDANEVSRKYQEAEPYPHLVIDNIFSKSIQNYLKNELVREEVIFSKVFNDDYQKNKTISTGDAVPPMINFIASKLASAEMLRYLEKVTNLKNLIPDPYYNTEYGYYHIVGPGGVLGSHVDHSHHNSLNIPHVLNLVIYLTEQWDEKDGGALCLFDNTGGEIVKKIPCIFNRAVIFSCSPVAYHGVEPITQNSNKRRHSLYFAYYSVSNTNKMTASLFPSIHRGRNNDDDTVNYGTYFRVPANKLLSKENRIHLKTRIIYFLYLFTPPIIVQLAKKIKNTLFK